jgi:hypothetical protein
MCKTLGSIPSTRKKGGVVYLILIKSWKVCRSKLFKPSLDCMFLRWVESRELSGERKKRVEGI